ncbi:MAG TPA: TIGR00269 family protein [Candidatus Binatia bacterium]|nr:TIGR00269 family protein [Candidatus Binatia bacterium]
MSLCLLPDVIEKPQWTADDEKFVANFEKIVQKTIAEHRLVEPQDKLVIAASGGKDSTVLLHLFHKLGIPFEAVTVDTAIGCYTKQNLINLRAFCSDRNIKLHELAFRKAFGMSVCYMRDAFKEKNVKVHSCTICGVPRRHLINKLVRELGATKVVTGHNLDDEAQAVMMNIIKHRPEQNARLGPASAKKEGLIPRIKPLYFIRENDVEKYSKLHGFVVHYGKCPCVKGSLRTSLREFFATYEKTVPNVRENIIAFFIKQLPQLREKYQNVAQLKTCGSCGEPSTAGTCTTCQLFLQLQGTTQA